MHLKHFCAVSVLVTGSMVAAPNPSPRLVDAVKNADKVSTRALIQQHVDVNAPEIDGTTALHWAARQDDLETAGLLIRGGANVKAANRYGVTPLSLACVNGNAAMIELLLKAGADANTTLPGGETALMTAARTGKVDAVKSLLLHGANVNAKSEGHSQTALMWAAAEGNSATVQMLIEHGADIHAHSEGGLTPLLFAVREGRINVVQDLLKSGVDVNEVWQGSRRSPTTGMSAMVLAVANAHFELASVLLDKGADPNASAQGWSALHQITWVRRPGGGTNDPAPEGSGNMSSLDLVKKLAARGANLNALMTKDGNNLNSSLNMKGATPFLMAARGDDAPLMRLLAQLGADTHLTNVDGSTALMVAAGLGTKSPGEDPGTESEALDAVKVAIELGGDVNAVDKNGETAIHGAAYKSLPLVAQLLIEKGAKPEVWNQKNKSGWTPLRMSEGIYRGGNLRGISPQLSEVLRKEMTKAGMSTVVEPQILDEHSGAKVI